MYSLREPCATATPSSSIQRAKGRPNLPPPIRSPLENRSGSKENDAGPFVAGRPQRREDGIPPVSNISRSAAKVDAAAAFAEGSVTEGSVTEGSVTLLESKLAVPVQRPGSM